MKSMPFRVASEAIVSVQGPQIHCNNRVFSCEQPVDAWDYLSELNITLGVLVDQSIFRDQTGLIGPTDLDGVSVTMQVDCVDTAWRSITAVPIQNALEQSAIIDCKIPAATVAQYLDISLGIVLDRPDAPPRGDRVAHLRGSRLHTYPTSWRVGLEGTGGTFPTEAVDFSLAGLDPKAPWHIRVNSSDLGLPFTKSVRLLVNTRHPSAFRILGGEDRFYASIIMYDFILQAVMAAADADLESPHSENDESLGGVLNYLCCMYLRMNLDSAVLALEDDRAEFLTRLKGATEFLMESAG